MMYVNEERTRKELSNACALLLYCATGQLRLVVCLEVLSTNFDEFRISESMFND